MAVVAAADDHHVLAAILCVQACRRTRFFLGEGRIGRSYRSPGESKRQRSGSDDGYLVDRHRFSSPAVARPGATPCTRWARLYVAVPAAVTGSRALFRF